MLQRHSIFFKLNLFFLLALLTLALLFGLFRVTAGHMEERRAFLRGIELARLLHHTHELADTERTAELNAAQFTLLPPSALPSSAGEIVPPAPRNHERERPFMALYKDGNTFYFKPRQPRERFVVRDDRAAENFSGMQLIFLLLLTGLITLYVLLRRSLLPLRTLHGQIRRFAQGELSIDTSSPRRDEIAAIANEFNDALEQLRRLRAARQLFLRNIMHELKTPLTKGKLTLAMMERDEQSGYLDRLLTRMDELINRLAEIEKLESTRLQRTDARLADLLEKAIAHLYLNQPREAVFDIALTRVVTLSVDAPLFVSALTNLLDNAVKYADTLPVRVTADAEALCIANAAPPLEHDIAAYLQPFSSGHRTDGFGLGLSIADTIVRAHGFTLTYAYEAGWHRFCIRFAK